MEPAQEQVVYYTEVRLVDHDDERNLKWLKLENIPVIFYVATTNLRPGDRVKITITKEPPTDAPQG